MTVKAATRWAILLSATMLAMIATLAVKSRSHLLALALPATIVVLTIGLEVRIARALRSIPEDQRGNEIPALLLHLLLLVPCIGLAGLIAALD
jgi:hypothetical protein